MTFEIGARKGFGENVCVVVCSIDVDDANITSVNELANLQVPALNVTLANTRLSVFD